jgi:hypothetical protein
MGSLLDARMPEQVIRSGQVACDGRVRTPAILLKKGGGCATALFVAVLSG